MAGGYETFEAKVLLDATSKPDYEPGKASIRMKRLKQSLSSILPNKPKCVPGNDRTKLQVVSPRLPSNLAGYLSSPLPVNVDGIKIPPTWTPIKIERQSPDSLSKRTCTEPVSPVCTVVKTLKELANTVVRANRKLTSMTNTTTLTPPPSPDTVSMMSDCSETPGRSSRSPKKTQTPKQDRHKQNRSSSRGSRTPRPHLKSADTKTDSQTKYTPSSTPARSTWSAQEMDRNSIHKMPKSSTSSVKTLKELANQIVRATNTSTTAATNLPTPPPSPGAVRTESQRNTLSATHRISRSTKKSLSPKEDRQKQKIASSARHTQRTPLRQAGNTSGNRPVLGAKGGISSTADTAVESTPQGDRRESQGSRPVSRVKCDSSGSRPASSAKCGSTGSRPTSSAKCDSPGSRPASRAKFDSTDSRPASRAKWDSPGSRPTSRAKWDSPGSRPTSRTKCDSPSSRLTSRGKFDSRGSRTISRASCDSPGSRPVLNLKYDSTGSRSASSTKCDTPCRKPATKAKYNSTGSRSASSTKCETPCRKPATKANNDSTGSRSASSTKCDTPCSRSASSTKCDSPGSRSASSTKCDTPCRKPATKAKNDSTGSRSASSTKCDSPSSRPALKAKNDSTGSRSASSIKCDSPGSRPAPRAICDSPGNRPASRVKCDSPGSRSASSIKCDSPGSRPASRAICDSPGNRPASRVKCDSPGSRSASSIKCDSPGNRPASRAICDSSGNRPASRAKCDSPGNRSASGEKCDSSGIRPASRVKCNTPGNWTAPIAKCGSYGSRPDNTAKAKPEGEHNSDWHYYSTQRLEKETVLLPIKSTEQKNDVPALGSWNLTPRASQVATKEPVTLTEEKTSRSRKSSIPVPCKSMTGSADRFHIPSLRHDLKKAWPKSKIPVAIHSDSTMREVNNRTRNGANKKLKMLPTGKAGKKEMKSDKKRMKTLGGRFTTGRASGDANPISRQLTDDDRKVLVDLLGDNNVSVKDTVDLMSAVSKDKETKMMIEELRLLETIAAEYEERAREELEREQAVLTELTDFGTKLKDTVDRKKVVGNDLSDIVQTELTVENEYGTIEKYLILKDQEQNLTMKQLHEQNAMKYLQGQLVTRVLPKAQPKPPQIAPKMTKNALRLQKEKGRAVRAAKAESIIVKQKLGQRLPPLGTNKPITKATNISRLGKQEKQAKQTCKPKETKKTKTRPTKKETIAMVVSVEDLLRQ